MTTLFRSSSSSFYLSAFLWVIEKEKLEEERKNVTLPAFYISKLTKKGTNNIRYIYRRNPGSKKNIFVLYLHDFPTHETEKSDVTYFPGTELDPNSEFESSGFDPPLLIGGAESRKCPISKSCPPPGFCGGNQSEGCSPPPPSLWDPHLLLVS